MRTLQKWVVAGMKNKYMTTMNAADYEGVTMFTCLVHLLVECCSNHFDTIETTVTNLCCIFFSI